MKILAKIMILAGLICDCTIHELRFFRYQEINSQEDIKIPRRKAGARIMINQRHVDANRTFYSQVETVQIKVKVCIVEWDRIFTNDLRRSLNFEHELKLFRGFLLGDHSMVVGGVMNNRFVGRVEKNDGSVAYYDLLHRTYSNCIGRPCKYKRMKSAKRIKLKGILKMPSSDQNLEILYQIEAIEFVNDTHGLNKYLRNYEVLLEEIDDLNRRTKGLCAAGLYLAIDWDNVLGVAYVGDAKGLGICGNYASYVITPLIRNSLLPERAHMISTMHELGHLLGSYHDPSNKCIQGCYPIKNKHLCSPENKQYIMNPMAVMGYHINNYYFSPCTTKNIQSYSEMPQRRSCLEHLDTDSV
ncbi:Disintegrin and metalloproteinase domain-containing protein 10 [Thelohanellus kitauei]|uniref:Disintegrin and metalloproteinase domain-containing protein 10 n=1 Tax=Thelohanellus kitauei TaxID=669202 RepID=A0A0C2MDV2_THEKT|nr:Disintegrin and metalloproteinase domain-containing protein 10 [Thelohanellus kitauei]